MMNRIVVPVLLVAFMLGSFVFVTGCSGDGKAQVQAPADENGKLVKKPKIGGPTKPTIGKPKNK